MLKPLPTAPDLGQLRKQAKELLHAFRLNDPAAATLFHRYLAPARTAAPRLHDAQFVVAREYGFSSWAKLKAHVESHGVQQHQQALDESMIRTAIKQHDMAQVEKLLNSGANIDGRLAGVGTTALGWAACNEKHYKVMQFLLARGASIETPANGNYTALACAAGMGNLKAVDLLLAHGAEVNRAQPGNFTVLHHGAHGGKSAVVRRLLDAGAQVNARTTSGEFGPAYFSLPLCGETPLHNAMAYGDRTMIQMLLEAGADIGAKTRHGETVFHWAARHKRPTELMKWLHKLASV